MGEGMEESLDRLLVEDRLPENPESARSVLIWRLLRTLQPMLIERPEDQEVQRVGQLVEQLVGLDARRTPLPEPGR